DGAEGGRRADDEEALRPGEAVELDGERAADVAAGAVGADQPAAGPGLAAAVAVDRDLDARGMLRHALDCAVELQLEFRALPQLFIENAGQLRWLGLHAMWMPGHVGDGGELELRQHAMLFATILERWSLEPLRDQRCGGAEPIEHVEGRRMKGRRARFLAQIRPSLQ